MYLASRQFSNIEYAHIAGRRILKYDPLYNLDRLISLFLVNYKEASLKRFCSRNLKNFRAIRGKIETFDISTEKVFLQTCNNLTDFRKVEIRFLMIEGCHKVSLNSLANIKGLNELHLLGRKKISSFDFVQGCQNLQHLITTTTDLRKTELQALVQSTRLEYVFLGNAPNSVISFVARSNQNIRVTNGDSYFIQGKECDYQEFVEETN